MKYNMDEGDKKEAIDNCDSDIKVKLESCDIETASTTLYVDICIKEESCASGSNWNWLELEARRCQEDETLQESVDGKSFEKSVHSDVSKQGSSGKQQSVNTGNKRADRIDSDVPKAKKKYKRRKQQVCQSISCEYCPNVFQTLRGYRVHVASHIRNKHFKCSFCGEIFKLKSKFIRHERNHTGERPFVCDLCQYAFIMKDQLIVHMRVHTNERPYKCSQCDKAFKKSSNLRLHELTHVKNKPYMCEYCGKSYRDKNELVMHRRKHTGENPYTCDICGKSFRMKNVLMVHTRIHTGAKPYRCAHCNSSFRHRYQLEQHTRDHLQGSVPVDSHSRQNGKKSSEANMNIDDLPVDFSNYHHHLDPVS